MSKYELISRLRELGFEAEIIDRIPYILNVTYDVADRTMKALNYNRTWGVKNGTFLVENHMNEEVTDGA
jgi:hypothetical protein